MGAPGVFHVAVGVVIEKEGKLLITQRSPLRDHAPNEWEAGITGRVDQGETCEQAAHREVREELGIHVELITPYRTFHFYRGKEKVEHLGVNYWAEYLSGEITLDNKEQVAYKWVTFEEALEHIVDEDVRRSLRELIEFKRHYSV
jgi:mutator protein MutT